MDCWKNIEIEIGIEIEKDDSANIFDPDFDSDFEKDLSNVIKA